MKIRTLIVDDEYPARQELRYLLGEIPEIEVVGEAATASEALALIRAVDYALLFLDIEMPGLSGLELAKEINALPRPPYVVFVTAYDEYALKAFEVNAVDYLLKPIEPKRLQKAVEKVKKLIQENGFAKEEREVTFSREGSRLDRIPAEKGGKTVLVGEQDIIYAYTEQDYVYIKTFQDKYFTRFTLKELEARLNPTVFFRCHRCFIVNLQKVREIVPFFNGTYTLVVDDKEKSEVPVSRAQAKKLRKILGL
ncbi:LytR/AlgR family response regulator transcription factor [Carboxydothermus pertinax]|uniref:Stage 0 sporulation protein A homolog n=1 Tax=Carboxydothermus pertinax TaxID=870242 RepID=A0A1L8CSK1_9THEO|nr:LytTR family DNA-binding domain-containing protein [Carboxydothermus pertinax]GAV21898.1 DNA-binding response regulator [Carboxydothermus pertinax]